MVDRPRFELATAFVLDTREVHRNHEISPKADWLEEAAYRSTIELEPYSAYVWGTLGEVHVEMSDLNEAE